MSKKILFLTGTRADFGKLKSLIRKVEEADGLEAHLFVTGMHMLSKYGMTAIEVEQSSFHSIYKYINQNNADTMDVILAKTIHGLSDYAKELKPDMIVVHGDRVEALAGATTGALNNILVCHIEGGEVSGTIDELIRHAISKMAHVHFVCNQGAKRRLVQLGELESSIYVIGSPDIDVMNSPFLPSLETVKEKYEISFSDYAIFMYHPVTTDTENLPYNISQTVQALVGSDDNFVVIYPNNDHGSEIIIKELERVKNNQRFKVYPSIRFEYFLTLLKNAQYMIGNSSAGVREAPYYGLPSINLGNRQANRANAKSILNSSENCQSILEKILLAKNSKYDAEIEFGEGRSDELFIDVLKSSKVWTISRQKQFVDMR